MTSENKTCAICLGSMERGQGQSIFTAECSHSFHFTCITNNIRHGNLDCPICRATWKDLPSFQPDPDHVSSRLVQALHRPVFEPELLRFSDDEPLPIVTPDPFSTDSQSVSIKATPEYPAIPASDSVASFSVLVGLTAPSLPENTRMLQRAPIDLVMVLDVSGSMRGSKLALLKRAANFVIDNLGPSDRYSIVSFSTLARRIIPLRRMTGQGRDDGKRAVDSLSADGTTNIVEGLSKGVQVLEERRHYNPVSTIMFLSDGRDTCHRGSPYLTLLPASIRGMDDDQVREATYPVHTFGFGSDHDPLAMHTISDSSGGTFSFIESYEAIQDAFACCIGGLLSVVTQELRLKLRSASHGVEIKSILSGRYGNEITNDGSEGTINVGDLYADEEKEFLINLSVPILINEDEGNTSLLDITCHYRDVVSNEMIHTEGDLVEIKRPYSTSADDTIVNIDVDRQRNRFNAAASMAEAQRMAEMGDLRGARAVLSNRQSSIRASPSGQVGDDLCVWLEAEMRETEERMGSREVYERRGRAYALSNMSSHGYQRATTRGSSGGSSGRDWASFGSFVTPSMANMVNKSMLLNKIEEDSTSKKE